MKELTTTYKMSTSQLVIEDETGSNTSSRRHSHDGIRSFTICHGNYGNSPHRSPSFFLGERNVSPYFNLDSSSTLNMDTLINNNKPAETENVLKIPNFVGKNRIDQPESRSRELRSSPVRPRRFSQDSDQLLGLVYKSLSQTSLDANIQMRSSADNIRTNSCADTVALRSAHSTETNPGFESTLDDIIESPIRNTRTAQEITRKWREMTKAQPRPVKTTTTTAALKDAFGPRLSSEDLQLPPYSTDQDNIGLVGDPVSNSGGKKANIKDKVPSGEDYTGDNGGISPRWNQYICSNREGLDPESLMFRDGRRKIDLVLAFEEEDLGVMTEHEAKMRDQRRTFLANLIKEGLELELEDKTLSFDEKTWFLKVHVPWKTETRYAEVMNMKLPTKRFITISVKAWDDEKTAVKDKKFLSRWRSLYKTIFEYDHTLIEEEPSFYGATAGKDREEQFIVKDRATTFTNAQRSLIAMQILLRVKYDDTEKVGIRRLLNDGTYLACFPLHEGHYECSQSDGTILDRRLLYLEWARPAKFYKKQPICLVRKYFGDQIGLYFAWLGFYTKMLYAPAIVGTLCFLYGLASMDSLDNVPSREICDVNGPGNITLCPLCDKACRYQKLSSSCLFSRITYLFDNPATVFFAIFMSFWARTFLELWKRKQNTLVWEWDLHDVEQDEEPRPEFETSVKTFRINPVTKEKEPYMPAWSRALRFIATGSAVLFMIVVVLGAVLGTIIYRISLVSVIYTGGGEFIQTHAKLFTTMTAALINLTIIMILTRLYHKLAISLTNLENPRTQTEYEESYTFKIFLFEFMNFYSSLIYIAFFKGRFYDYPGDGIARKSEFFRLKGDVCDPAGCLSELCIQLAIIMIGKQVFNNFLEILYPKMWNWWRQRSHRANTKDLSRDHMSWEQDYHLQDPGRLALFDEYLEMILQYGFVTLFVAAFPLAPLFALLNNIAEIRLDAYKMVTQARRPLAERVEDIGAWERILSGITYVAVISNAFVIAYTSDFIPRMVYKFVYSESHTLVGYIDHSLSVFNTSDYQAGWGSDDNDPDPPTCQYRGYRNGPEHPDDAYGLSPHYWHVFAARLSFVVIFEHVVYLSIWVMRFVIPTTPSEVKTQIQREKLLAKEAKYEHGLKKNQDMEYEELISALRENNVSRAGQSQPGIRRSSWARRLSRMSDGLDAHVEVSSRPRKSIGSTVWEVT